MNRPPGWQGLLEQLAGRSTHSAHDELVRLVVRLRARDACEYCLMPTVGQFQVDHIIPVSVWLTVTRDTRGAHMDTTAGPDHVENYAWACPFCNGAKHQKVGRRVRGRTVGLFNPRRDWWPDHFAFFHGYLFIAGFTEIGRATERTLGFNDARLGGPLGTRHDQIMSGRYPPVWARDWLVSQPPA